jgi:hypothetical protein
MKLFNLDSKFVNWTWKFIFELRKFYYLDIEIVILNPRIVIQIWKLLHISILKKIQNGNIKFQIQIKLFNFQIQINIFRSQLFKNSNINFEIEISRFEYENREDFKYEFSNWNNIFKIWNINFEIQIRIFRSEISIFIRK